MLVSVQTISEISPIPGADFIEAAQVLGWVAVVRKGEFKPGDKIVYFEYNSLLPPLEIYSALWSDKTVPVEFRLRTKKLKGVISQGLIKHLRDVGLSDDLEVGTDVQEILNVKKFTAKTRNTGKFGQPKTRTLSTFPTDLLPKTDETKLQSCPRHMLRNLDANCAITQKLDGQSLTVIHLLENSKYQDKASNGFLVCTRNQMVAREPEQAHWTLVEQMGILDRCPAGFALQGEFCGGRIQGNKMGFEEFKYFVFNVVDLAAKRYLSHKEMVDFCKTYDFPTVPVLFEGLVKNYLGETIQTALKAAEGKYKPSGAEQEGVVVRIDQPADTYSERVSFKVISNKFLLAGGDDEDIDEASE